MNRRPSLILSFLLVVVAGLLFTGIAAAGDQDGISQFKRRATIQIPGNKLEFFDISFVDAPAQRYVLADRSNASIDIIDTHTNGLLHQIGGFAGQKFNPDGTNDNAHSGPDGVLIVHTSKQIWAGDGDSTVKVFDLDTHQLIATISTCIPGHTVLACARADEMAYDPRDHLLIVANNAGDPDAFMTLISTTSLTVVDQIVFPAAKFSGGIEQPVWDPATRRFYVSIPELNGDANKGAVAVINPRPIGHATIETLFPVDDCNPAGLALGPHQHLLLGCSLKNGQSVIMDARNGHIVKVVHGVGGSDEVWFNKGDDRYYLAARNNVNELGKVVPALGIIDAGTNELLAAIPTGTPVKASTSAHSVAADRILNHVFVPLPPLVGDAHCANGCIGVYWSEDEDEE
jgi:hypothetical protein